MKNGSLLNLWVLLGNLLLLFLLFTLTDTIIKIVYHEGDTIYKQYEKGYGIAAITQAILLLYLYRRKILYKSLPMLICGLLSIAAVTISLIHGMA